MGAVLADDTKNEIKIFWDMDNNDLETRKRVKKYIEDFPANSHCFKDCKLNCTEYDNGLHITGAIQDENKVHNCMWSFMMNLAECRWFRSVVKECVWTDGDDWDELISGTAELIAEGQMKLHD